MPNPTLSQLDLELFPPEPELDGVDQIIAILHARGRWLTATQLLQALDMPVTESNRRWLRRRAEAAEDTIISGQRGYCHVDKAHPSDVEHFASWMISQGKKMIRRGIRTQRRAHALIG